jgi:ubiquinol oxidase
VWWERLLIRVAQAVFVCGYTTLYVLSRAVAHRFVGYLEEHAVNSYTRYLDDLRRDPAADTPAPRAAILYWDLAPEATMSDVVEAVRRDEVGHREENHGLADSRGSRSTNWLPSPSP